MVGFISYCDKGVVDKVLNPITQVIGCDDIHAVAVTRAQGCPACFFLLTVPADQKIVVWVACEDTVNEGGKTRLESGEFYLSVERGEVKCAE